MFLENKSLLYISASRGPSFSYGGTICTVPSVEKVAHEVFEVC